MDETEWRAGVMARHMGRCVAHTGCQAQTVHHRIHGHRADLRPSNGLPVCGDGTTGAHGWIEHHGVQARALGWVVSRHGPRDATLTVPVWMPDGLYGRGWYLLDDEFGFAGWPGSVATQDLADPPPLPWETP